VSRGHTTTEPTVILTAARQWVELLAPLEQGEHALQQAQRDSRYRVRRVGC
jgi:hypothetical protein